MRKYIFLFAVISFINMFGKMDSTYVYSKHEVSLVANTVSLIDIANGMFAHRESNPSSVSKSHYPINIHGRYMYNINSHIAVGALVGYDGYIDSYLYTNVTFRAYWFYKKHFGMYSFIGAGPAVVWRDKSCRVVLSPDLVPVGVDFGGIRLRGFMELCGIGSIGVFSGGVKYSF